MPMVIGFFMDISVNVETKEAVKYLRRVGERNIPLAVAQSLTATAKHLQKVQTRSLPKYLDRPTKFPERVFALQIAKARDFKTGRINSAVLAKDVQQGYLQYAVYGGTLSPKGRALIVPGAKTRLNRYGNLTCNCVRRMAARDDTFSAYINGVEGLYQRTRRGNKLLVLYAPTANYDKRYPFHQISARIVPREITKQLNTAIIRAAKARR